MTGTKRTGVPGRAESPWNCSCLTDPFLKDPARMSADKVATATLPLLFSECSLSLDSAAWFQPSTVNAPGGPDAKDNLDMRIPHARWVPNRVNPETPCSVHRGPGSKPGSLIARASLANHCKATRINRVGAHRYTLDPCCWQAGICRMIPRPGPARTGCPLMLGLWASRWRKSPAGIGKRSADVE